MNQIINKKAIFLFFLSFFICMLFSEASYASPANNKKYNSIISSMQGDLDYALENYEIDEPGFTAYDRKAFKPLRTIPAARYHLDSDGIYRTKSKKADGVACITFTGDLMCQSGQQEAALKKYGQYEFDDNYVYVKRILSNSDFTVGNLETMLSERASFYSEEPRVDSQPQCNAPSTYLDAVRAAGYDMVVTANNHNCDTGVRGIFQTIGHLEQYELIHTGTFTNKKEKRYKIVEIDGIKVAWLSYARYYNSKNKHLTETGQDVMLNYYTKAKAKRDINAAKKAGAEFVIVYIHWGVQFSNTQNDTQVKYAKELADVGADYIIGSHPHALQPYDHVTSSDGKRVPVAYSMGNFVSHMLDRTVSAETIILKIELTKNNKGKVVIKNEGYIPCRTLKKYKGNNYTTLPLTSPYNNGMRTSYGKEAYGNITSVISNRLKVLGRCPVSYLDIMQGYKKTTYTGNEKQPKITVKTSTGRQLKIDKDYTIVRENCTNVGYGTITVNGKGQYYGTWSGTVLIRPVKTSIRAIEATRKSITVQYLPVTKQITGYEIAYSTSDNFKNQKIVSVADRTVNSKKIKNLEPDTKYYVRIRTYKIVSEEKIYSNWSKKSSVLTDN